MIDGAETCAGLSLRFELLGLKARGAEGLATFGGQSVGVDAHATGKVLAAQPVAKSLNVRGAGGADGSGRLCDGDVRERDDGESGYGDLDYRAAPVQRELSTWSAARE